MASRPGNIPPDDDPTDSIPVIKPQTSRIDVPTVLTAGIFFTWLGTGLAGKTAIFEASLPFMVSAVGYWFKLRANRKD